MNYTVSTIVLHCCFILKSALSHLFTFQCTLNRSNEKFPPWKWSGEAVLSLRHLSLIAATSLRLDFFLTSWCHIYHIFTSINEPLSYSECYLSHEEGESIIRWVTKQSRPSRKSHRDSLNKHWPQDAANRRQSSAIIRKSHSQDTSQIWICLFLSHRIALRPWHHLI